MNDSEDIGLEIIQGQERFDSSKIDSYFKYISDDENVFEGIFTRHVIRFTQPRMLNDPLESSPIIRFHDNKINYQNYELDGVLLPNVALFSRVQLIESQINYYGILSLTKNPFSFNMWSQYAKGHKGFIIEFKPDFNFSPSMKSKSGNVYEVRKIEYVDEYSICLDDIVDKNGFIPVKVLHDELYFKKTARWKYENEYRMIRPFSDYPDYQQPETNYAYTDTKVYLFPFDFDSVASIILGASMSQEHKIRIMDICEKNNIVLHQAHIIRDVKDKFGEPSTTIILQVEDSNKYAVLNSKPQLFCTDTVGLSNRDKVKITKLSDLPYYKDHEQIVEELYRNLQNH